MDAMTQTTRTTRTPGEMMEASTTVPTVGMTDRLLEDFKNPGFLAYCSAADPVLARLSFPSPASRGCQAGREKERDTRGASGSPEELPSRDPANPPVRGFLDRPNGGTVDVNHDDPRSQGRTASSRTILRTLFPAAVAQMLVC
ncbi:hypothetical protein BJX63DRAFT_338360 [Aspergillus granulosus]|uniref:Uncharacterized protein n=1 Tax=Aspergillus granulosus TaxID=176169 RepID=A0ABR4HX77_9EURO